MKRVLIVDDAYELGRMLRAGVETLGAGLDVRLVPSAEEALLEHSQLPVDLMVADIRLPGMSGLDLAKRLRERGQGMKILLITGLTDKAMTEKAAAAGADRFLTKPFLMSEFLSITGELLGLQPAPVEPQKTTNAVESAAPTIDLPGVLQRLRKGLGAQLVILADERGKVVAQTGERTDLDFEKQWAPAIQTAISAMQKTAHLISTGIPQGALVLRGVEQQLILAPVGDYALVIALGPDSSGLRSALALEDALNAQTQLIRILENTGADFRPVTAVSAPPVESQVEPAAPIKVPADKPVAKPVAEAKPKPAAKPAEKITEKPKPIVKLDEEPIAIPPEPLPVVPPFENTENQVGPFTDYSEAALHGLQALLDITEIDLDSQKTDDYWEQALSDTPAVVESPNVLTYDEAHQLGLTPEG